MQLPFHLQCYKLLRMCRCPMSDIIIGLTLLYHCEHGGVDLMGLKPDPLDLSFSALTLLVGSFDP